MRACFYIEPGCSKWVEDFFPNKNPGELPIAGKSLCRHIVDQCSSLKITDIYIPASYHSDDLLGQIGQGGDYWSLRIRFLSADSGLSLKQILKQHPEMNCPEGLLFFQGMVMPDISGIEELLSHLKEMEQVPEQVPDGVWLMRNGKLYECVVPLFRMRTLREYFDLNFRLLEKPGIYNLPGYFNSEGCVFGMDVLIMPECELEKPVLIQDHVRLGRRVTLSKQVIIGKDVLINDDSRLEHSIVFDHTYIGKHMSFRNMIIDENRVIDVSSETMVELEDEFLAASSRRSMVDRFKTVEFIIALILLILGLPLFLIALLFRKDLEENEFFSYFLLIYPKCLQVLRGRAHLVRYGQHDENYVFRYSDQWLIHQEEDQKIMDDIYFYYNRSVLKILSVVIISLLRRIVTHQENGGMRENEE